MSQVVCEIFNKSVQPHAHALSALPCDSASQRRTPNESPMLLKWARMKLRHRADGTATLSMSHDAKCHPASVTASTCTARWAWTRYAAGALQPGCGNRDVFSARGQRWDGSWLGRGRDRLQNSRLPRLKKSAVALLCGWKQTQGRSAGAWPCAIAQVPQTTSIHTPPRGGQAGLSTRTSRIKRDCGQGVRDPETLTGLYPKTACRRCRDYSAKPGSDYRLELLAYQLVSPPVPPRVASKWIPRTALQPPMIGMNSKYELKAPSGILRPAPDFLKDETDRSPAHGMTCMRGKPDRRTSVRNPAHASPGPSFERGSHSQCSHSQRA
jgi:hypothetical protein